MCDVVIKVGDITAHLTTETWGFVEVRPGAGASWKVPPADAYRTLAAEVERRRTG